MTTKLLDHARPDLNIIVNQNFQKHPVLLLTCVQQYLDANGWHLNCLNADEQPNVSMDGMVKTDIGSYRIFFDVIESKDRFSIYVYSPTFVPQAKMELALALINHLNQNMFLGKITLNTEDGALRSMVTINTGGTSLSDKIIEAMEYAAISAISNAYPCITALCFGDSNLEELLALLDD